MKVGDVFVQANLNNSAFNNQVSKTVKSSENAFSKGFSKIGKMIATTFAVGAIIAFGKTCVDVASQTQSAWIGLESILQGQNRSVSQAKDFLNEYTKDGLIPLTNAVTAYKNLASRGYDDSQITQTLTSLKDAAAFGRQASYSYGEAIQTATEGLKNENSILVDNAGVTKNVAKMWDEYAKSIGTTSNKLTQQQKIQAEVNGILEETKFQIGDAAKYSETFAGRTARLSATFYQLKTVIGEVVMPIANLFIPVLQKAMEKLIAFFNLIKQVMGALGLKSSKPVSQVALAYDGMGGSALQAADDATKAAKKVKKANALMGYDELNILKKPNTDTGSGSSSGGGGAVGGGASIGDMMGADVEDTISPKAQKIADNIKKYWEVVKNAFSTGGAFVKKHWKTMVAVIAAGAVTIGTALLGIKIAKFAAAFSKAGGVAGIAKTAFAALSTAIGAISLPVLAVIAAVALLAGTFTYLYLTCDSFRSSVNEVIGAFANALTPAFQFLTDTVIPDLVNGFNGFIVIMQPMIDFVGGVLTDAWSKILQPALMYVAQTVIPTLLGTFQNLWKNVLVPLGTFIGSVLKPVVQILSEVFTILWKNVLLPFADFVGSVFSKVFESVYEIYNKLVVPIIQKAIEKWQFLWTHVLEPFVQFLWTVLKPQFEQVCNNIGNIMNGLKKIFTGVLDFVTGVFTLNWSKAWDGVKSVFQGVWTNLSTIIKTPLNLILAGTEGMINGIIKGFNLLKTSLNKMSFNIPDWVPGIGGKKWGFNFAMSSNASLPRLAQGGWVEPNKPRPVIVGDNKREGEIIAPESKIYDQTYRAALAAQNAKQQNSNKLEITLIHKYPDGREMIHEINETQIKDGKITLLT